MILVIKFNSVKIERTQLREANVIQLLKNNKEIINTNLGHQLCLWGGNKMG